MHRADLDKWLESTSYYPPYWDWVEREAKRVNSDGCTGVIDFFVWT